MAVISAMPSPPLATTPVVRVDQVNHFFGEGESRNQVLFQNCLTIEAGQLVIMTGPSGSGKTTLLTLVGALRSLQEGTIEILGHGLAGVPEAALFEMRRDIGFIFQMHNLFEALSAYENVQMAMQLGGCPRDEMRERGTAILTRLGLGHRIDYKPKALSGGQRQRVAVARAIVNRPRLILADEPTAALDKEASHTVVRFLKELAVEDQCTIIMVTHDNRILEFADRIVNMVDGRIVSDVVLRDAVMICEFLKTVDVFQALTPTDLTHVAEQMKKRRFAPGDVIIRQGDPGEEFFLVAAGRVAVTMQRPDESEREVAVLEKGQFFGERALITGEPRNATVRALEEVETYVLDQKDFRTALDLSVTFHEQLMRVYFQRQ
jgi:putative ABC transport system ATP-binding protein